MRTRFFVSTILAFLLVFVLALGISFAETPFLPAENPTGTAGLEFVVPIAGSGLGEGPMGSTVYVTAIYNNTKLEFDTNGDGVADNITYLNKSQTIGGSDGKNDLSAGTWIRADKPVLVVQRNYAIPSRYNGFNIPKSSELGTDYYVPTNLSSNIVYITAAYSNTTLRIDQEGYEGPWEITETLMPGRAYEYTTLLAGAHIKADKPIVVVQMVYDSLAGIMWSYNIQKSSELGADYYVPTAGSGAGGEQGSTVYITSLNTSTKVDFDTNADGIYDRTITVPKSNVTEWTDLPASTHIHANDSIVVVQKAYAYGSGAVWGYELPKVSELGMEYYVPTNLSYNVVYVTAAYSNTTLQIDNDNNNNFEFSTALMPGATYTNTTLLAGAHLHTDKPIMVVQRAYGVPYSYGYSIMWGYKIDPVAIDTREEIPGLVDFNTVIGAKVRTTNPTSATIYNLSYNLTWPANFSFSGAGSNITVTKYNLTNDAVTAGPQSNYAITPTLVGNVYTATIDKNAFATTLANLTTSEYIVVEIKLQTPSTSQVLTFGRVNLTYAAKGWRWIWP